ncbi:hypothetical protein EES41_34340 [Streptomyces sp. ADI95-16]|uniref:hypothetical protein n=1 Tax=Streptomyces sp. ADI95-16 TaxID=1522758 RepID=UPI000F3A915C|nr:hypothetical protein [Streptomyces sp. ADI95-16]AYV31829.1 hypothetical protein EES41_34340 [Streptomyces sp. ADI95-16]
MGAGPGGRPARTYTLVGTRGPDGQPVRIASGRAAGTVITRQEGRGRRRFELTDAVLSDGTYAAEPLDGYR